MKLLVRFNGKGRNSGHFGGVAILVGSTTKGWWGVARVVVLPLDCSTGKRLTRRSREWGPTGSPESETLGWY